MAESVPVPAASARIAGDTREAILVAIERLLEDRRLEELTVVDLIETAGVSRATFYVYFESKHAAVAARAERVMEQIHDLWSPWLDGLVPNDLSTLEGLWMDSIEMWRGHRALLMAAAEAWRADPFVSAGWCTLMQRYALTVVRHIENARSRGLVPAGPDAVTLATVLVWLNESAMYMAFSTGPEPKDDRSLAQALAAIWLRSIYCEPSATPRALHVPVTPQAHEAAPAHVQGARLRRRGNADVRRAILAATGEVLRQRSLDELTVSDVIEAAGFSRPTFYMYFESKDAAVAALAEEVLTKIYDSYWRLSFECDEAGDPPGTIEHFATTIAGWREHRAVMIAACRFWRHSPTVYRSWGERMQEIVDATEAYIVHARAAGMAPPEPDAGPMAVLLIWLTETIFYLTLAELDPGLADDGRVAATLSAVWTRAIHGDHALRSPAKAG